MRLQHLKFALVSGFLCCGLCVQNVRGQEVLRYSIVSNNTKAGSEVDTFSAGGRVDSAFEFNDRGRGPKLAAHYVLGADGAPMRTDITGNDYLKAPVEEQFAVEGGKAHWKSTSEDGSGSAGGVYVSANGSAVEAAIIVAGAGSTNRKTLKTFAARGRRTRKKRKNTRQRGMG